MDFLFSALVYGFILVQLFRYRQHWLSTREPESWRTYWSYIAAFFGALVGSSTGIAAMGTAFVGTIPMALVFYLLTSHFVSVYRRRVNDLATGVERPQPEPLFRQLLGAFGKIFEVLGELLETADRKHHEAKREREQKLLEDEKREIERQARAKEWPKVAPDEVKGSGKIWLGMLLGMVVLFLIYINDTDHITQPTYNRTGTASSQSPAKTRDTYKAQKQRPVQPTSHPPGGPGSSYSPLTAAVQDELNRVGYQAGPVDGLAGVITQRAIAAYETSKSLPPTGAVTTEILKMLESEPTPNRLSKLNPALPTELPDRHDQQPAGLAQFTNGSTEEALLRIQGQPDTIKKLPSFREVWTYGASTVYVSTRTGKVIGWNNNGDLKAHRTILDPRKKERIRGDLAKVVEQLAQDSDCTLDGPSNLLSVYGEKQYYEIFCRNGSILRVSCEGNSCRVHER